MRMVMAACALLMTGGTALSQEAGPAEEGRQVYDRWCTPCHGPDPRQHPGTAALEVLYKGEKPAVLEERTDLTPDVTMFYVRTGVSIMPFFRKTEISDGELAALAAYLDRSARD